MSWARGRETIVSMLASRELSRVVGDLALAERLVDAASRHLETAKAIRNEDPELAYCAIHDAVRKAMAAMLQAQGLRPTAAGGHIAVQDAVRAQFGDTMGALLRPVDRIRTTRHRIEYPIDDTYIDPEIVMADLPKARALVEAAR